MSFKELLKKKGVTQEYIIIEFRQRFKHMKYQQQVSEWVNGKRPPDLLSTYYLAKILNESVGVVTEACLKSAGVL